MTYREARKRLESEGWALDRQRGSHRIYVHGEREGLVVLAGHQESDQIPKGTLSNIKRQAGWDEAQG